MIHLSHNPDKLEAKALDYERKGKTAKATKYREKAARVRGQHGLTPGTLTHSSNPIPVGNVVRPGGVGYPQGTVISQTTTTQGGVPLQAHAPRTPAMYEANALKWEKKGNWEKAQKNREKVWRLRNPQHGSAHAPRFYRDNNFLGYELLPLTTSTTTTTLPTVYAPKSYGQTLAPGYGAVPYGLTPLTQQPLGGYGQKRRDPLALEAKAAEYQRRGKAAKAAKLRNKAERVRAGNYVSARTPDMYERNALKWEKKGNWDKAQKNRAKYWKHKNPQYASQQAPSFYNSGRFLGYEVPYGGQAPVGYGGQAPFVGQTTTRSVYPLGGYSLLDNTRPSRDPARLEARAAEWDARGRPQKAQRLRSKAAQVRAGTYVSQRTPDLYERNALKWEKRGKYDKAQKNRAKAWRLKNPNYAQHSAPSFYNNNSFLGYSVPFTPSDATLLPYFRSTTTNTSYSQGGISSYNTGGTYTTTTGGLPYGTGVQQQYGGAAPRGLGALLPSRDPARLEARAIEAERKGKPQKALKLRQKAAKINSGSHTYRTIPVMETKALRWEQEGNWKRAQKQRAKIWRLQNPHYLNVSTAPSFYNNNLFLGYNVPFTGLGTSVTGVTTSVNQLSLGAHTVYAAPIVEHVVRPTIVTETQRPERIVEVQPIIHREVEAPTLRIIEQHVYETVPSVGPNTITNAAIVHETVTPMITEEVQQIVHREVPAPFVERVEQHVTEHIVQPVVQTKEVVQDTTIHTVGGVSLTSSVQGQTVVGAPFVTEQTTVTQTTTTQPQQVFGQQVVGQQVLGQQVLGQQQVFGQQQRF